MVKPGVASKCSSKIAQIKKSGMNESVDAYLNVQHMEPRGNEALSDDGGRFARTEGKHKWSIIIVLLISILGNIILGVFFVIRVSKPGSPADVLPFSEAIHGSSVCVLCSSLSVSDHDLTYSVDRVIIGDTYMCCIRNSEHIQKLITLLSLQYSDSEKRAEIEAEDHRSSYQSESAAHLYLDSMRFKEAREIVWTDEYGWGSAYVGNGVKFSNGSLSIKEGGRYYVYSFITTKFLATPGNQNLLHAVYRRNQRLSNLGSTVLLIGKQNLSTRKKSFLTSYLGASVVLRAGDELTVGINPRSAIYAYAPANYFGLFKIR